MQLNKKLKHSHSKKVRTGLETAWKPLEKWPGNENEMGTKSFCTSVSEVILKYEVGVKNRIKVIARTKNITKVALKSTTNVNEVIQWKCYWSHLWKHKNGIDKLDWRLYKSGIETRLKSFCRSVIRVICKSTKTGLKHQTNPKSLQRTLKSFVEVLLNDIFIITEGI